MKISTVLYIYSIMITERGINKKKSERIYFILSILYNRLTVKYKNK
jgi:hypothetical protein